MANTNRMKRYKSAEELLSDGGQWTESLETLREILLDSELEEGIKWGMPVYMLKNKNVAGLGFFKSYVGIWFYQGMYMTDEKKKLINAQEGKTVAMRQWRFSSLEEIQKERDLIKAYIMRL